MPAPASSGDPDWQKIVERLRADDPAPTDPRMPTPAAVSAVSSILLAHSADLLDGRRDYVAAVIVTALAAELAAPARLVVHRAEPGSLTDVDFVHLADQRCPRCRG